MKRKLDFILDEEIDERILFRFYPRRSHVHGFGKECPKSWDKVYKVYYCWSIIKQDKWRENNNWESRTMFEMYCDECSELGDVPNAIEKVTENRNSIYLNVFGDGAEWQLTYYSKVGNMKEDVIEFQVWDRVTHQGYKFPLYISEAIEFKRYINMVQEYMLNHSVPI